MISGIVAVDKPPGMTSHDIVNQLRRIYRTKKVGHTGTLDPDATGVLPVCIGQATRLAEYFSEDDKVYRAVLRFGFETDTQDASGEVVATYPLPTLDRDAFEKIAHQFLGQIEQEATMYSAIKYQGKPLYKYALQGIIIPNLPTRSALIHSLKVLSYSPEAAHFEVHCSKGTYIRTLCVDIARACGSGGHMSNLRRLAAGSFSLEHAVTLETLKASNMPEQFLIPMSKALPKFPGFEVGKQEREDVQHGRAIAIPDAKDADDVAIYYMQQLVSLGTLSKGRFQPRKVFQIEDER